MAAEQSKGQAPLSGVVLCCTSIAVEQRDEIHKFATGMGALCFYDLTVQVTHLIIGDVNTLKYSYVAKERPDVKVLLPTFVEAARTAWMAGDEIDIQALEETHRAPTFFGLQICLTGFSNSSDREALIRQITENGAKYSGDLTKLATHLIAKEPVGKKYAMAPEWGVKAVSLEWLSDSLERGMALDESLYDLRLEQSERGKGAWNRAFISESLKPGKRQRDDAQLPEPAGKRKIRRTVSAKLSNAHESIWQDMAAAPTRTSSQPEWQVEHEANLTRAEKPTDQSTSATIQEHTASMEHTGPAVENDPGQGNLLLKRGRSGGVFTDTVITIHGFSSIQLPILQEYLTSHGAKVLESDTQTAEDSYPDSDSKSFVIVPHDVPFYKLPPLPEYLQTVTRVTEWWVENCLFRKVLLSPDDNRLCRPFFTRQIPGFDSLSLCSTSFSGPEVLQISKMVKVLGATYDQYLKAGISVLICGSSSPSEEKLRFAYENRIPAVTLSWIWSCIDAGRIVPIENHLFGKSRVLGHDSIDTFTSASHETVQTLSISRPDGKHKQIERSKPKSGERPTKHADDLKPGPASSAVDKRIKSFGIQDDDITFTGSPAEPLQELSPATLNSPPKRSHQMKSASPEKRRMSNTAPDNSASSAKSEHLTSALSMMLAAKCAARPLSLPEPKDDQHVRRKRSALGRASSASFEISQSGKCQFQKDPIDLADQGDTAKTDDGPGPHEEFLLSQKITYEDSEILARKARLLAELGGPVDEDPQDEVTEAVSGSPMTRTRRKTGANAGAATKPRSRRKN